MADLYIENEKIKAGINYHGAELVSIFDKASNREIMWSGDSKYWGRVSPVLFPFVGKLVNSSYKHNDCTYSNIPQHGYARDCDFCLAEKTETEIFFELRPDENWNQHYPFNFTLRLGYKLEGKSVHVMWTVINNDMNDMHFSIGAHPAFYCPPTCEDSPLTGYQLDLHTNKTSIESGELNENGLLKDITSSYSLDNGKLSLCNELFDKDALIIDGNGINTISLLDPTGKELLQVKCDVPQIGIWSPAGKKAPFLCIEPWFGRSDRVDFSGDLCDREYGNTLAPGHSFNKEYVIEIA